MSERNTGNGPNLGLLLLIPAAVIVAKGVHHHRMMWESGWTPDGAVGHGHGHALGRRGRFGGDGEGASSSFRLPPRIEWMLETWHDRAHEKADVTDSTAAKTEEGSETV